MAIRLMSAYNPDPLCFRIFPKEEIKELAVETRELLKVILAEVNQFRERET
jgi:uncharacterized protein Smg (DUF494 family)